MWKPTFSVSALTERSLLFTRKSQRTLIFGFDSWVYFLRNVTLSCVIFTSPDVCACVCFLNVSRVCQADTAVKVISYFPDLWWVLLLWDYERKLHCFGFTVVKAYQYTSMTSVMLLDCWAIPCVLVLTCVFLKTKYRLMKISGVVICIFGVVMVVFSDVHAGDRAGNGVNWFLFLLSFLPWLHSSQACK